MSTIKVNRILTSSGGEGVDADIVGNVTAPNSITVGSAVTITDGVIRVGTAVTIDASAGVITATRFDGDGSALSGIDATSLKDSEGNIVAQAEDSGLVITGVVTATTFSGPLTGNVTSTGGNLSGISTVSTTNLTVNGNNYPSAGPLSNRNMLTNGDMRVAQRGTAAVTTSGTFPVDRWTHGVVNAGVITAQQVTDTPVGFKKAVQVTITTADATVDAGDVIDFQQWIEANNVNHLEWGTANAKNVTLSFWVKASVAGTYCNVILGHTGSGVGHSYVSEYTISAQEAGNWVHKVINVPGPTSGTFATQTANHGIAVRFSLTAGTNLHQAANSWGTGNVEGTSNQINLQTTQGATWAITGIQLEVGSVATPFEHRSYGDELNRCQRYYQTTGSGANPTNAYSGAAFVTYPSNAYAYGSARFHSTMRTTPTVVIYDNSGTSGTATQNGSANGIAANASHITINGFSTVQKSSGTWYDDARYTIYCGYTASAEL